MNKILLTSVLFFLLMNAIAQNVGINNADPKAALDLNGGFRLRSENTTVTGTSVMLTSNRSHHVLIGSPVADFNIAFTGATETGQHAIITNTTLYKGLLVPIYIQPNTTVELIYSNGAWKLIGTNEAISTTAWSRTGNGGTIDGVNNLFGTTDAKPIRFIENSLPSGYMDAGRANYFFGGAAGTNMQASAQGNTGVGYFAMFKNTTGLYNVAIGSENLQNNKQGSFITSLGVGALNRDTAANETVALGAQALYYNQARFGNTAVGTNALYWNTFTNTSPILASQGLHNTALGHNSLLNNRRGSGGVAIGFQAAYSDTASDGIVAIGRSALELSNGKKGVLAIGDSALYNNGVGSVNATQGNFNLAIGSKALFRNTTGSGNIAIGGSALFNNQTANGIVAIGDKAAYSVNVFDGMVAIGRSASYNTTNGFSSTAIGDSALFYNINGISNTAVGNHALINNLGGRNTALGDYALYKNTTGAANTALGLDALLYNTDGVGNTVIGAFALAGNNGYYNTVVGTGNLNESIRNISYSVFLGAEAGRNETTSRKLYIDNSSADKDNALIYGDFGADSLLLNAKTVVRNNAVVRGYTKLGGYETDVPSIKMKKISIPAGPVVNGVQSYPLGSGITDAKVVGIQVLMNYAGSWKIPPSYIDGAGYEYNVQVQNNNIVIVLKSGNSANIGGKPISVIVTYEE